MKGQIFEKFIKNQLERSKMGSTIELASDTNNQTTEPLLSFKSLKKVFTQSREKIKKTMSYFNT